MAVRGLMSRMASGRMETRNTSVDVESIVEHLRFLLNTRIGEAVTVPDYGIEDLSDLTTSFPDAADIWKRSIRATIEKYEPRLRNVRVRHSESDNPLIIAFEISARLTHGDKHAPLKLQTHVDPKGEFKIS